MKHFRFSVKQKFLVQITLLPQTLPALSIKIYL